MIIPVHQGNHWTAMMVDVVARRLVFFDSMLGENRRAMAEVKKWVADEAKVGCRGGRVWGCGACLSCACVYFLLHQGCLAFGPSHIHTHTGQAS